jgi:hypothetical protein
MSKVFLLLLAPCLIASSYAYIYTIHKDVTKIPVSFVENSIIASRKYDKSHQYKCPSDNSKVMFHRVPRTRTFLTLDMILPRDGFEEAESVAERLYRRSKKNEESAAKRVDVDQKEPQKSEPTTEDDRKTTFELDLARPLGLVLKEINGYGVFVEALTNGSAILSGVRRGDRIVATGSTIGNIMWEKNSLDGILAAVNSGEIPRIVKQIPLSLLLTSAHTSSRAATILRNTVRIRFERDAVLSSIVGFSSDDKRDVSRVDLQVCTPAAPSSAAMCAAAAHPSHIPDISLLSLQRT